jgi:cation:H+ antiporter
MMIWAVFEIAGLLLLIVFCCSLFTNAIEWTGHRFKLSEGAVGSVLAAVGTALPETLVPIIAIASGLLGVSHISVESGHDIGIGAILGAPFLLGTLALCVTASALFYFAALKKRDYRLKIDRHLFRRDLHYFFPAYLLVFGAAFIPVMAVKQALAIGLLLFYGVYVYRTVRKEHIPDEEFDLPALMFAPHLAKPQSDGSVQNPSREPSTALILLQVAISLAGLLLLVHLFVGQIQHVATFLGIPSLVLSLIITPIATEMPEKFNSVVWIRGGKDNLALGNITGAMVFQSCIPTAVGLLFTPWQLNATAISSVLLCLVSSVLVYLVVWKRPQVLPQALFSAGFFYLAFIFYALFKLGG